MMPPACGMCGKTVDRKLHHLAKPRRTEWQNKKHQVKWIQQKKVQTAAEARKTKTSFLPAQLDLILLSFGGFIW